MSRRCWPRAAVERVVRDRGAEEGFVAGSEALVMGVLVFVVGTLLIISGWTLVDAKIAVEAAAREAARAVVESPADDLTGTAADELARTVALDAMAAHRGPADAPEVTWRLVGVELRGERVRCGRITATVTIAVDTVRMPMVGGGFGTRELVGEHVERIEPYRAGLPVPEGGVRC